MWSRSCLSEEFACLFTYIVLFAALVLVAQISGRANEMTALGAQLFFWARLAYAVVYLVGIPWLRTGVWFVSMIGLVLIFLQLL